MFAALLRIPLGQLYEKKPSWVAYCKYIPLERKDELCHIEQLGSDVPPNTLSVLAFVCVAIVKVHGASRIKPLASHAGATLATRNEFQNVFLDSYAQKGCPPSLATIGSRRLSIATCDLLLGTAALYPGAARGRQRPQIFYTQTKKSSKAQNSNI